MPITIKEIHVKTTVERKASTGEISPALIRQIRQCVLDEPRYQSSAQPVSKKER